MNSAQTESKKERYILRIADVEKRTGYKRAYIYRLISRGDFPKQSRIGIRSVGWDSNEIDQWIDNRLGNTHNH